MTTTECTCTLAGQQRRTESVNGMIKEIDDLRARADALQAEVEGLKKHIDNHLVGLRNWKDEHHDCDCPPHESCGCKELSGLILALECEIWPLTDEDVRQALGGSNDGAP